MINITKIIFYLYILGFPSLNYEMFKTADFKGKINNYCYRDTTSIIGKWVMCSEEYHNNNEVTTTKYNVCPVIEFNLNGYGKVVNSDEVFIWRRSNDTLTIKKSKLTSTNILTDSIYTFKFEYKKEYVELQIIDMTRKTILILGKDNK